MRHNPRLVPEGLDFRSPDENDTERLVELAREFFELSAYEAYGIEFSEETTRAYIHDLLRSQPVSPSIVATVEGRVVGFVHLSYDFVCSTKPVAILQYIFVEKAFRRTVIARMLIRMAADIAKQDGCCAFFTPVNSGSRHIGSLHNMLMKSGFTPTGYIATRRL